MCVCACLMTSQGPEEPLFKSLTENFLKKDLPHVACKKFQTCGFGMGNKMEDMMIITGNWLHSELEKPLYMEVLMGKSSING